METTKAILIIDDSESDRMAYRRYLKQDPQQAYTFSEVDCAEDGLALCKQQTFDIILLDFLLPDMSGLEVLSSIVAQYSRTSVIMLTGYGDEQLAVNALKGGAQDYLVKEHLSKDTLQRSVRTVLTQQHLYLHLKKTQQQHQLITQLAFQIRHSLELTKTLESVVSSVRQVLQCDRVLVYQFAPDMSGQIIAESVKEQWRVTLGQTVEDTYFQQQGAEEYRQGRRQVVNNVHQANLDACHLKLLEQFEVKAIFVVPVLIPPGEQQPPTRLWGLIVAHQCDAPRKWQPDEVSMVEALSIHCAIAIQHAELLTVTQAALEKEKALNEFKSQIVATVSHEYNSPLTAIRGAAELLHVHKQQLDVKTRERLLEIILSKSKHMSALVQNMLLEHSSGLDSLKVKLTTIDLEALLTTLIADQQVVSGQHRFQLKARGDLDGFRGDAGLVYQIFSNLLLNAIKYSPEGGDVQIYLVGDEQQITCSIKDQGIGIAEQDQAQLFQSFYRGSNVGTIAGTGLGLKIVKDAIDLHNGSIEIMSQEEKGTQIRVCLPKQI